MSRLHFAGPMPLWLAAISAVFLVSLAVWSYRRPLAPLSRVQHLALVGLRATTLLAMLLFVLRPIVLLPARQGDVVVPILLDVSRSMRMTDAGSGQSRLAAAVRAVETTLQPELSRRFTPEIFTVGDTLTSIPAERLAALSPDRRHSNLTAALNAINERYRGRRASGVVLLSDGGDTTPSAVIDEENGSSIPVFAVGVGKADGLRDREIVGITAGDPRLDQSSVDLRVSAVAHGYGAQAFEMQVRANSQLVESRRVTPAADGSPIDELFTVVANPLAPTVVTIDIPAASDEAIAENNTRSILLNPAARRRRILAIEGAPGFEHSFLMRALGQDAGLEVDAVVRKGKDEAGRDTFFVQAGGNRAPLLTQGLPQRKDDLFAYDAIVIANVEGEFFSTAQLTMVAEFVSERGGGLLVLGGRSFAQRGLIGTPLEPVLPVELTDRRGGLSRSAAGGDVSAPPLTVVLTPDGEKHPVMRVAATLDETKKKWAAFPPLAATAPLGGARPGAAVLAVTAAAGGLYPVIAVQQYGRGRSMLFGGEAAWRWRMKLPAEDRSYEFFWRQAARWLAGPAPDRVTVDLPASAEPGDSISMAIDARDEEFVPAPDATIDATLTPPGGEAQPIPVRREASGAGRFVATSDLDRPGVYRVHVEARRGGSLLGTADRWLNVGGADREFANPRLNEGVLRRIAAASGGRYVPLSDLAGVTAWLDAAVPQDAEPERRDIWHQPWAYALVVAALSAEWILRRRWGLR